MGYQVIFPAIANDELFVTLIIPSESNLPAIDGQWERNGTGEVAAWYTRDQLREAVAAGLAIRAGDLEARLAQGERLLIEAQQRADEAAVARLERHWVALLAHLTRTLAAQRAVAAQ